MLADDVLGDGKTKSRSIGPAADHRVVDAVGDVCRYPRTVVDNFDLDDHAVPVAPDGVLPHGAGRQADARPRRVDQRFLGVAHDVEYRLDQLAGIALDFRQTQVVVAHEGNAVRALGFDELNDAFEDAMNVDLFESWPLVGSQHAVDQVSQAIRFLDDDLGVLPLASVRQLPFE